MTTIPSKCTFSTLFGVIVLVLLVTLSTCHVAAQTLESTLRDGSGFKNIPQIKLGQVLEGMAFNWQSNKLYVTDFAGNSVSVLDSNSGDVSKNIRVGLQPTAIVVDPFSNQVYVADQSETVTVIDGLIDTKEAKTLLVQKGPARLMASAFQRVYVLNPNSRSVSVIDTTKNTNIQNINTGPGFIPTGGPSAIAATGPIVYVTGFNEHGGSLSIMDTAANTTVNLPVINNPSAVAVIGNRVYVAGDGGVSVIDTTKNTNIQNINAGPGFRPSYMAAVAGNGKMSHPPSPFSGGENGDKLYVAGDGGVSVIDTAANTTKRIPVALEPRAIGLDPDDAENRASGDRLYVAGDGGVSVINTTTDTNIKNITTYESGIRKPSAIATGDLLYVLNSDSVSVIKTSNDRLAAGITFNVSPENSGNIQCNADNNPNADITYPTNTYLYVEAGTKCIATPNKDFEFSSWIENLGHNSTITLSSSSISDSPLNSFLRFLNIKQNDTSATFVVGRYGSFTANFRHSPPAIPAEYWIPLYGVIVS